MALPEVFQAYLNLTPFCGPCNILATYTDHPSPKILHYHFVASKDFPRLRPPVGLWFKIKSWWKWQAQPSPLPAVVNHWVWVSRLLCEDRGRRCSHRASSRGSFGWEETVLSLRWQSMPRGEDAGRLCSTMTRVPLRYAELSADHLIASDVHRSREAPGRRGSVGTREFSNTARIQSLTVFHNRKNGCRPHRIIMLIKYMGKDCDSSSLLFLKSLRESQTWHPQKWHNAIRNGLIIKSTPLM